MDRSEYNMAYHLAHKSELNRRSRERNAARRDELKAYNRQYYASHRQELIEARISRRQKRLETDPVFRLLESLRARVRLALKGNPKDSTTLGLTGCTSLQFRTHLEARFQLGMTWENYGQWHVDHIRPCDDFDLSRPEQQRLCFHYSNLQPLWALDNLRKGARYA